MGRIGAFQSLFPDLHDLLLELVTIASSTIAHAGTVVVNRRHRVAQEVCDLGAVGDAEADECEDTQLGIELLPWLELYLLVLTKERIEVLDEGREEVDEGRVEAVVELCQLRLYLLIV